MMAETQSTALPMNPIWESDATHPQQTARLREAWTEVTDPELGLSILQLGLIRQVTIRPEGAHVVMILTTPFCPYGPALMENARQKAEAALNTPVSIELGEEAWDRSMMDEDAAADWGLLW
jgi:metal-sulfur cluster biosynthetic enzyme